MLLLTWDCVQVVSLRTMLPIVTAKKKSWVCYTKTGVRTCGTGRKYTGESSVWPVSGGALLWRRLCIWPCSVPAPALVLPLIPGIHQAGQVEGLALRRGLQDRAVCLGRQHSTAAMAYCGLSACISPNSNAIWKRGIWETIWLEV